jgi:Zn-dependent protease with chaperone function
MNLKAFYFDGKSSRRHNVRLDVEAGCLLVHGPEKEYRVPLEAVRISEPQGRAPRTLRLEDGSYCEIEQGIPLTALLDELGHRESTVVRLQNRWRWSFSALIAVILTLTAGYLWGLPWGAKLAAPLVPIAAMQQISEAALNELDEHWFKPTRLSQARQQKLRAGFQQIAAADPELAPYGENLKLFFRSAPGIGPNAFALPGGQVVLLDELVGLHDDDNEILAVLAHELGHLNKRHGTRQLIQSSVVAAVAASYLGDLSYAASALTAFILNSGYSRDMEREADAYAAATLSRQGKSPVLLANALEKLENFYTNRKKAETKTQEKSDWSDWLSSHPDTQERIQYLKSLANES